MASLHLSASPPHFVRALSRLSSGTQAARSFDAFLPARFTSIAHVNFRLKNDARINVLERWCPILASKTNPPEESNIAKTSDTAQGPPFLTILAGFVVFLGIVWILRSFVMWLFGFIVRPAH
ncbi:hypothetical protein F511_07647 [Dorcoceras hygrometricum]|uniref:Uncharacterized protein n=1 Tax=Dorcoceras hygrometricum TaxID=472368 RepID=A0A2Z7CRD9_9LAMI|nr:hypothetical protein F511_07647 [Dorcoceras hygrometricum]